MNRIDRYKAFRSWGRNAEVSLRRACEADGYVKSKPQIAFNAPFERNGKRYMWIENASACLRSAGYADEICKNIWHRGWFTRDDDCDSEVYRGIVYRLPHGRAFVGYADPCNQGCALVAFEPVTVSDDAELIEAARAADRIAEIFAESERDYQRAWLRVSSAHDRVTEARKAAREALEDVRDLETCDSPRIQKRIKDAFAAAWSKYRKAMSALIEALDNDQGVTLKDI